MANNPYNLGRGLCVKYNLNNLRHLMERKKVNVYFIMGTGGKGYGGYNLHPQLNYWEFCNELQKKVY